MKALTIVSLLLVSCSYQSIDELTDTANDCGTTPECRPLWEKVYKREAAKARREREDAPCPKGLVKYTDWRGSSCITRSELDRALGRM